MATDTKVVSAFNGLGVDVYAGFNQAGFVDGNVVRLSAELMSDISAVSSVEVSERASAVNNTMRELVRCFNEVHKSSVPIMAYDFKNGKFSRSEDRRSEAPAQAQAQATPTATINTPVMAVADTSAKSVKPIVAPTIARDDVVLGMIKDLLKQNSDLFACKTALIGANPRLKNHIEAQVSAFSGEFSAK